MKNKRKKKHKKIRKITIQRAPEALSFGQNCEMTTYENPSKKDIGHILDSLFGKSDRKSK